MKKILITSLLLLTVLSADSEIAIATDYGDNISGASTNEVFQIRYDGAAWNYNNSRYVSTSFSYSRNNVTLLTRVAYNGKVTGSVYDNIISGDKYTTYFNWWRGGLKPPYKPVSIPTD